MLLESIRSALESIRAHGFRSLLTSLGIIIGVTSVIAVVSIVQGLSYTVNAQFAGLGGNSLTIRSYTPFKKQLQGRFARLTDRDMQVIERRIEGISDITPILYTQSGRRGAIRPFPDFIFPGHRNRPQLPGSQQRFPGKRAFFHPGR